MRIGNGPGAVGGFRPFEFGTGYCQFVERNFRSRENHTADVPELSGDTKIYLQGKEYYDKLRGVTNLVRNARRVQQCILLVGEISDIYVNNYDKMLRDEYLTVSELTAIARGYTSLLQEGTNLLRDLQTIINPSQMSMTDKERLDIIDKCYTSLSHLRNRAWLFTRCNIATAVLRARESNDLKRSLALYGTDEEKYW